jgi:hypothetical protein
MDLYALLVFLHVLGAAGLFTSLGMELTAYHRLRRAVTADAAREALVTVEQAHRLGHMAIATIVVPGIAMMALRWGPVAWILAAQAGIAAMAIAVMLGRRTTRRLADALAHGGELPADVETVVAGPLRRTLSVRVATAIGILGLMTVKPGVLGSLGIIAAAVAIGLVAPVSASHAERPSFARGK